MRVGIIGRGFGARTVAPAFDHTDGCEVVDVVSPRDEHAVASLCERADVDLISVHSPPFMHLEHVNRAIEGCHAVLCDKPFGRNADEARQMCQLADEAGVVNLVNFEARFDPVRVRLRALVQEGRVGDPHHFQCTYILATSRFPLRPYGWLFDADLGGGWLRALGSHIVDFVRWTFGEVVDASAELRTAITERPDADQKIHRCTADDGFTAILRSATGVTSLIDSTFAASANLTPTAAVIGSDAVLQVIGDRRIIRHVVLEEHEEFTCDTPGGELLWMRQYAPFVRDAVHAGGGPDVPTFADGLACVEVLDRLAASGSSGSVDAHVG